MKDLIPKWREYIANIQKLRVTVFELIAHPDVTPEQLWQTHEKLVATMQTYREMLPKVRAKWPAMRTFDSGGF